MVARSGESGIALITALLVSAVIMAVGLGVNLRLREQVAVATRVSDLALADLKLRSAYADVVFHLASSGIPQHNFGFFPASDSVSVEPIGGWEAAEPVTVEWNVVGLPFVLQPDGVEVTLRNGSSVLELANPDWGLWERLLTGYGVEEKQRAVLLDSLRDWIDGDSLHRLSGTEADGYKQLGLSYGPRNYFVQGIDELGLVNGMTPELLARLRGDIQVFGETWFNPLGASRRMLVGLYGEKVADQVMTRFTRGNLDLGSFIAVTGFDDSGEGISLLPGRRVRVTLVARQGRAVRRVEFSIVAADITVLPYMITEWR